MLIPLLCAQFSQVCIVLIDTKAIHQEVIENKWLLFQRDRLHTLCKEETVANNSCNPSFDLT